MTQWQANVGPASQTLSRVVLGFPPGFHFTWCSEDKLTRVLYVPTIAWPLALWLHKWNESGFRPPLCTYRLNWARRTSWGWWDDWDDTVLQTQDSKFEPWRSEAEHATSRSRRLPTILTFTRGWGRNIFVSFKPPRPETEPRTLAWKAAVLTATLGPPPCDYILGQILGSILHSWHSFTSTNSYRFTWPIYVTDMWGSQSYLER